MTKKKYDWTFFIILFHFLFLFISILGTRHQGQVGIMRMGQENRRQEG